MAYVYDEENLYEYYADNSQNERVIVSSEGIPFYESEMDENGWHIENDPPKRVVIIIHKPILQKKHRRRYILRTRWHHNFKDVALNLGREVVDLSFFFCFAGQFVTNVIDCLTNNMGNSAEDFSLGVVSDTFLKIT